jgi:4-hydroxybenzoate polyprenyltransferase/phosphoserine phosphatase
MTPKSATEGGSTRAPTGPLVVDLDGTLIRSDLLWECVLELARKRPWLICLLPFWGLAGRAQLKARLARLYTPNLAVLPFRQAVLDYCRAAHETGRPLILASASPSRWVESVAAHLGYFDTVLASDERSNLKGAAKLRAIRSVLGTQAFSYMGDSAADAPIWENAEEAIGVGMRPSTRRTLMKHRNPQILEGNPAPRLRSLIGAMRPLQWAKNLLIFAPLILAHELTSPSKIASALLCFLLFCAVASAGYIINDLLDLETDRAHPAKRHRPIASGNLPISAALLLLATLLVGAGVAAWTWAEPELTWMLGGYLCVSLVYSFYIKRILLLDVLVLAALYTLRVLTGGVATDVVVSPWLLVFSGFLFLSLAFVKRYLELLGASNDNRAQLTRRAYTIKDIALVETMGISCGFISVLVLCLFVNSSDVSRLYGTPNLLWMMCPVMLYWISRIWLLAHRGEIDDDPVLFALRDPQSYIAGTLTLASLAVAATW